MDSTIVKNNIENNIKNNIKNGIKINHILILPIADLKKAIPDRKEGYEEACRKLAIKEDRKGLYFSLENWDRISEEYKLKERIPQKQIKQPRAVGPGSVLKLLLRKMGLKPVPGCKCGERTRLMNKNGIEWCESNIDTIIGWLKEEDKRIADTEKIEQSWGVLKETGARIVVKRAISISKKRSEKPIKVAKTV